MIIHFIHQRHDCIIYHDHAIIVSHDDDDHHHRHIDTHGPFILYPSQTIIKIQQAIKHRYIDRKIDRY